MLRACVCLALVGVVAAVTPVEKVVTLLSDLKASVESEGKSEAFEYDKFACFCKDTTKEKSNSILSGRDTIESLSAAIAAKSASKEEQTAEFATRKANQEAMTKESAGTDVIFAKEKAEYDAAAADLSKAISSLESAMKAMEASKPTSLLEIRKSVEDSLALAEALNLVPPSKTRAVLLLLQVDPTDPAFKFHSQGIIDTLSKLLKEFMEDKRVLDEDWAKTKSTHELTLGSLKDKLLRNSEAMGQLEKGVASLLVEIAQSREALVNSEAVLKDDQLYIKDLTERCEFRAKDWDQRSQLRADELKALEEALAILTSRVAEADTKVNKRVLLQRGTADSERARKRVISAQANLVAVSQHSHVLSLFQEVSMTAGSLRGTASLSARARQERALAMLSKEGQRLGSATLSSLAAGLVEDPFAKVKTLLQRLIERLLAEATAEATKKGFCDEQLGKAHKERDFRFEDTQNLEVDIQNLEIKLRELQAEVETLTDGITHLNEDLKKATGLRDAEHTENLAAIKEAKAGFEAVDEALKILKAFYAEAAKAKALIQVSPVDEDTVGPGFTGAYQGKQEPAKGIIGLLEVIKSDFDRTIRSTESADQKAHEQFVEFDRASKTDIFGKKTKKQLDQGDAETTANNIAMKMEDLRTAQSLLDAALKKIEDLKPTCVDTGMSFEERVAKREEEMAALKRALCILDTEGSEQDCK